MNARSIRLLMVLILMPLSGSSCASAPKGGPEEIKAEYLTAGQPAQADCLCLGLEEAKDLLKEGGREP